ncbi:hypothetical protein NPIL_596641 [Nephila pilipes]|uniref:Uncharacterized protein n=1 Tax=Nephila pilipes TaxID=299642 RepID=A0A8X6TZH4_NEPPI|nr:hypothetical protein NPIL_596641 [Nephila pilipes]
MLRTFSISSKYCQEYEVATSDIKKDYSDFHTWSEGYKPTLNAGHCISSCAMYVKASYELCTKLKEIGFISITMLSDGESTTFLHLNESMIYGADVKIKKKNA